MKRFPHVLMCASLALILGACSSAKAPAPSAGSPTSSRTPGTSTPKATSEASPGAPTTTARPTTTTTTTAPEPEPVTIASANTPPAAGTYTYDQDGATTAGSFSLPIDATGTLQIDAATNGGGGKRQRQLRTYSKDESNEQHFLFRSGGVFVESTTAHIYGQSQECTTTEPLLAIKLPLTVGSSWKDSGDCSGLHIALTGKVLRTEMFSVGGKRIKTFVIKETAKASGDSADQSTVETIWISPDYRMVVHSVSDSNGTAQGFAFTSHRTETLRSLTPT